MWTKGMYVGQIWLPYSDFCVLVIRPTFVRRSPGMTSSRWWSWMSNGSTQPYPVCPMCASFKNSHLDTYAQDKSRTRRLDRAEDALSQLSQIFKYCLWQSPRCRCLWRASSALHNYSLKTPVILFKQLIKVRLNQAIISEKMAFIKALALAGSRVPRRLTLIDRRIS